MALWDNPGLAAHLVRDLFLPQVQHLREAVMKRLLVTFDSISEEAEAEGQELWESASKLAHPDADPGSIAEAAEEAAYTKHSLLEGVRQGLLNMSAAWLGHLVEQQSLVLLRRMYLRGELRPPGQDLKLGVLQQRMLAEGLDLSALEGWSAIRELRLVTKRREARRRPISC